LSKALNSPTLFSLLSVVRDKWFCIEAEKKENKPISKLGGEDSAFFFNQAQSQLSKFLFVFPVAEKIALPIPFFYTAIPRLTSRPDTKNTD